MLDTRIPDGLIDIRRGWTLDDVCHAHDFIDELDRVGAEREAKAREAARLASAARRR